MTWQQKDKYYLANGDYTICKVSVNSKWFYELWKSNKFVKQGFTSSADAIKFYEEMKK